MAKSKSPIKSNSAYKRTGKENYVFTGGLQKEFANIDNFITEKNDARKQVTRIPRTVLDAFLAQQAKPAVKSTTPVVAKPTKPAVKPTVDEAWLTDLGSAYKAAIDDARNYFTALGLDPDQYQSYIKQGVDRKKATIPSGAKAPGSFFGNVGEEVYNFLQNAARTKAQRGISDQLSDRTIEQLLSDTSDDAFIEQLLKEQLADPTQQIENLRARGMYNDKGFAAAMKALTGQSDRVRRQLGEIGTSVLEQGRSDLRKIQQQGQSFADSLLLGQAFDPFSYRNSANKKAKSFLDTLGSKFRSYVPSNLFDTSGLSLTAGRAQGAQNTPYDYDALSFFKTNNDDDDDDDDEGDTFINSLV